MDAYFITVILSRLNGLTDMDYMSFGNCIVVFYITALFGSISIISLSLALTKKNKYIRLLSDGTILIVGFNLPIIGIIKIITKYFFPNLEITPVLGFIIVIQVVFISLQMILFAKKYVPIIIGNR